MEQESGSSEIVFIYGLIDRRDGAVQYVGATAQPRARLYAHRQRPINKGVSKWMKTFSCKSDLEMVILEETTTQDAGTREDYHIAAHLKKNPNLLNVRRSDNTIRQRLRDSMARFQLLLPRRLKSRLERLHKSTGLSVGEHIRRAIDDYLRRQK